MLRIQTAGSQPARRAQESTLWASVSGGYTREESGQNDNAVLQMKYLSNGCALFEFRLVEGGQDREIADTLVLPFVLTVDEDGIGRYASQPEGEKSFNLAF